MARTAAMKAAQAARRALAEDSSDEEEGGENRDMTTPQGEAEAETTALDADAGSPTQQAKRKREDEPTPDDEAELARRRRRRQSLVFQHRRKSLTYGKGAQSGADKPNRQYISDMYSTIIKMSSENKINVKNSWSLQLIDHMEDILAAPQEDAQAEGAAGDTFNFQKASCTLDASVKIYSYRVDDTWTSSFKILENLSRNGGEKRKDTEGEDEEHGSDEELEEDEAARRAKKKGARKAASARTIERNMNNITLRSLDLEFEPDPLFHKMSQTFDEGGAKGLLLANLGVYDGAKILLNSSDVRLATRRLISEEKKEDSKEEETEPAVDENADADTSIAVETAAPAEPAWSSTLDIGSLGKLSCFTKDIMSMKVCPQVQRLYTQVDDLRGPETATHKVLLREKVLEFDASGLPDAISVSAQTPRTPANDAEGGEEGSDDMMETDDPTPETVDADAIDEPEEDTGGFEPDTEEMDVDFDGGGDSVLDTSRRESVESVEITESIHSGLDEGEELVDADGQELSVIDPVLPDDLDEGKDLKTIKSATDYFRVQAERDPMKEEAEAAYSRLIETVLMRSGDDATSASNDYAYFDAKIVKNWAGPTHNKFRANRKGGLKAIPEDLDGEVDGDQKDADLKANAKGRKPSAADKKLATIDFLSNEVPNLDNLLKPPKSSSVVTMSKMILDRHKKKSSELVFPVDAHIDTQLFFQHFLKPRLQIFTRYKRRTSMMSTVSQLEREPLPDVTHDYSDQDFGVTDYASDDGGMNAPDDDDGVYSSEGLLQADRVVEKIDIHYERVAKRVDVKKLKTSIWSHIEKETPIGKQLRVTGRKRSTAGDAEPDGEQSDVEELTDAMDSLSTSTNFHSVVERVANKVPSNVTVSFYFICMLHLANEKGLRLVGQDDLSNFQITKDEET